MDGRFPTTSWGVVRAARGDRDTRSQKALASLCEAYWYPLYAYLRHRGYEAERARDLTQTYFCQLLDKDFLKQVRPDAGKFRSFLLMTLQRLVANERDRALALKRGGGRTPISLDLDGAEVRYRIEPADHLTPERLFERRWARTVVDRALDRLRREVASEGKTERFDRLKGLLVGEESTLRYRELAEQLGTSEAAVKVSIHRLRKRFGNALRAEVAETVAEPDEIDEEIRYLLGTLTS